MDDEDRVDCVEVSATDRRGPASQMAPDFLTGLPVGLLRIEAGVVTWANEEAIRLADLPAARLPGVTAEVLTNRTLREDGTAMPADEGPIACCLASGAAQGPVTIGLGHADGAVRWAVANAVPTEGERGQRAAFVTLIDITGRVQSERRLRESESRIRALVEGAFEGIAISVDGTIVDANEALARMLGYAREELLGFPATALIASDAAELLRQQTQARSTAPYTITARRKDGSTFPAELLSRPATYLGREAHVVGVRDVTERERAASALRRWEHIFQTAPLGVAVTRPDGVTVELLNRSLASKLEYQLEELIGRPFLDLFAPESRGDVGRYLERLRSEARQQFEAVMRAADGKLVPVSIDAAAVCAEDGALLYRSFHIQDISARKAQEEERRQLEEQIRHAQKLESLGVLAGGIAHDFNNLLMAVMGYADLALKYLPPRAPAIEFIELVQRSSRRAADLANQMLAYAGRARVEVGTMHVNDVIAEMVDLLKVSLSKKVRLHLELSPSCPPIDADAAQIRQVVMNLVTNASEAIGDATGDIYVTTRFVGSEPSGAALYLGENLREGANVVLEVRDTGIGMDAETRRKLFEPFFTTKFTGRGLGLAAVFGIIRSHRGAISVATEPGRGSTFRVFFPASARAPVAITEGLPSEWRGSGLVLLADDEEMVRRLNERVLLDAGFSVVAVGDGRRALEVFRQRDSEIRLAILDVTMPEYSGTQVLEQIRRARPGLPVILISGYQERDVAGNLPADGRLAFLHKPFPIQTLLERIQQLLELPRER